MCLPSSFSHSLSSLLSLSLPVSVFSQMIHLSSWGSSLSPLPQSSLTSWSPRTRAAQPTSRLYSEGGTHRGPEGGCTGGGRGWILGSDASEGEFYLTEDRSSAGHKQLQTWIPLVVNLRAGASKCPEIGERMLDKLIISYKTLQRYLTDLSRHCQSSMGLVKAEHKELYLVFK